MFQKFLVVLAVAVACASADVSHLDAAAPVVRSDYEISPEGAFQYAYETGNGISAQASGLVKNPNSVRFLIIFFMLYGANKPTDRLMVSVYRRPWTPNTGGVTSTLPAF